MKFINIFLALFFFNIIQPCPLALAQSLFTEKYNGVLIRENGRPFYWTGRHYTPLDLQELKRIKGEDSVLPLPLTKKSAQARAILGELERMTGIKVKKILKDKEVQKSLGILPQATPPDLKEILALDWKKAAFPDLKESGCEPQGLEEDIAKAIKKEAAIAKLLQDPGEMYSLLHQRRTEFALQFPQEDPDQFNLSELEETVANTLADFEIRNKYGYPQEWLNTYGGDLEELVRSLRNALSAKNFPYKKTVLSLGKYQMLLSCLYEGKKGLSYWALKANKKLCEKKVMGHWEEKIEKNMNFQKNPNFHLPTYSPLTIIDINNLRDSGLRLLAMIPAKTVYFDGSEDSPFAFFIHDLLHSEDMLSGDRRVAGKVEDIMAIRPQWAKNRKTLERVLQEKFPQKDKRELHDLILFYMTHETQNAAVGVPVVPHDKAAMLGLIARFRELASNPPFGYLPYNEDLFLRLTDWGDLGQGLAQQENLKLMSPFTTLMHSKTSPESLSLREKILQNYDERLRNVFYAAGVLQKGVMEKIYAGLSEETRQQLEIYKGEMMTKIGKALDEVEEAVRAI